MFRSTMTVINEWHQWHYTAGLVQLTNSLIDCYNVYTYKLRNLLRRLLSAKCRLVRILQGVLHSSAGVLHGFCTVSAPESVLQSSSMNRRVLQLVLQLVLLC